MSEQVSALADGEIGQEDNVKIITSLLSNKKSVQAWREYQLIGDAMRGTAELSADFTQNFMQRLEQEPTVLSPNAQSNHSAWRNANVANKTQITPEAADQLKQKNNDRLPAVWSIAASCAAVMVVGWVLVNQQLKEDQDLSSIKVAQTIMPAQSTTAIPASTDSKAKVIIAPSDPAIVSIPLEYLAAHQVSAPSISSYYIQAASYSE